MSERFENDLDWVTLGGAFAIWTAHFMLAWTISSTFPGKSIVLWLTLALTLAALAALAWLWRSREIERLRSFGGLSVGLATVGVLYDFLPALMA